MGIRQMGPLVGGAISLALNIKTAEKGKVTYTTTENIKERPRNAFDGRTPWLDLYKENNEKNELYLSATL